MKVVHLPGTDRSVRYWTAGSGAPLLYLHGLEGPEPQAPFLQKLAQQFTVIAPEHPGFGESEGLDEMRDITDLVLHYRHFIETLGLSKVHVVGHCLGGMFAAEIAAFCPHRVDRLVLVGSYGLWLDGHPMPDPFVLSRSELTIAKWGEGAEGERLEAQFGKHRDPDRQKNLGAATRFLWPLPDRGLERRLRFIQAPTLIVHGERDGLVPPVYAKAFAERIAGAKVEILSGSGHLPMIQSEDQWLACVQRFLG